MTKLVQVTTVDNFDNSIPAVETITFVYNGVAYTLDLGEKNLAEVREVFRKYAAAADRVGPATVTVQTEEGTDVLIKPRTKVAKAKPVPPAENTANGHVTEPPAQPTLLEPNGSPPGLVSAITQAAKAFTKPPLPAFTSRPGARAATPEPEPQTEPPDDGLPPDRSWLHLTRMEKVGSGSKERARRGTAYRNAMRDWLRANGYPDIALRGKVAEDLIGVYWQHVLSVRASTMEPA